jgi:hypothetical protein
VLRAGERRTFHLTPGRHVLDFTCTLSPLTATSGRLPLELTSRQPARVALVAKASFSGVQMRLRAWQEETLIADHTFPSSS